MDEVTGTQATAEAPVKETPAVSAYEAFKKKEQSFNVNKKNAPTESKPEKAPENKATPEKEAESKEKSESKPESHPEKEPESDESADKRLKDKDRFITKLIEKQKALESSLEELKTSISKKSTPEKPEPKPEKKYSDQRPPEPSEDDDLKTYNSKLIAIAKWEIRNEQRLEAEAKQKEQEEKRQSEELDAQNKAFNETVNESIQMAVDLFPDYDNPESELRKEAVKYFEANKKSLKYKPNADWLCCLKAAEILKIEPVTQDKKQNEQTPKKDLKVVQKPSLMELGSSSGASASSPLQGKLSSFIARENQFIKKR